MFMKKTAGLVVMSLLLLAGTGAYAKEIVGYAEKVRIYPGDLPVRARIDTGANLASLHCDCITPIKRNGEDWVSFTVTNFNDEKVRLEQKVHRIATIKRHFGETQQRYVIKLGICLGSVYKETEVGLIDRKGLKFPMLVGRKFMENDFLVDSSIKFSVEPECQAAPKSE
jgi:hypothetical protein